MNEKRKEYYQKYWQKLKTDPERYKKIMEKGKIRHRRWRERNRDRVNRQQRKRTYKLKLEVLGHYSLNTFKCNCCGRKFDPVFLTIDHIKGRKKRKDGTGIKCYRKLRREKYPQGYQVLCWNCNAAKGILGNCPCKGFH